MGQFIDYRRVVEVFYHQIYRDYARKRYDRLSTFLKRGILKLPSPANTQRDFIKTCEILGTENREGYLIFPPHVSVKTASEADVFRLCMLRLGQSRVVSFYVLKDWLPYYFIEGGKVQGFGTYYSTDVPAPVSLLAILSAVGTAISLETVTSDLRYVVQQPVCQILDYADAASIDPF